MTAVENGVSDTGITLVLGSGGARGYCFIGVLKALDDAGIPIGRIIGASMGAILGAAYASGKSPKELEAIASEARPGLIPTFSFARSGLLTQRPVRKLIEKFLREDRYLEDLSIPTSVICTDYATGIPLELRSGDMKSAVLGSCVAGAVFDPVERDGNLLVDAGYSAPVPVQFALPGRVVVAVSAMVDPATDPNFREGFRFLNLIPGWFFFDQMIRMFDIQGANLANAQLAAHDHIYIKPEMADLKFTQFRRYKEAIAAGYEAMRAQIPYLQRELALNG